MITIVDRNSDAVVQKIVRPGKQPVYQVVPKDGMGDFERIMRFPSLAEARLLIGKGQNGRPVANG